MPLGEETPLDRLIAGPEARHPQESAFRLVVEGPEAFVLRAHSARLAGRSLDVQTYIWHGDVTGLFLAHALVLAADRGVKVRLLVDDMDARAKSAGFAALAAHPLIEVRLFNPFSSRRGVLLLLAEGVKSFRRVNHRMHNKSWIADDRFALAGGRNLGDEYFGASEEVNFVDLDLALVGPVVRDATASFERYWSSPAACPMEQLDAGGVSARALDTLRKRLDEEAAKAASSRYADALRADDAVARLCAGDVPVQWAAQYRFVADDPLKATLKERDPLRSQVITALTPVIRGAQVEVMLISPYFVPGREGTAALVEAARAGKRVRVLTNSLVANDVAAVHGGYSRHRKALVASGVELFELKPSPGSDQRRSVFGSSGASLHTKACAVDGRTLFVGSYNLDPRSTWLNCEQGVLVESPVLAREFEQVFAVQAAGQRAWRVAIDRGELWWSDGSATFGSDPLASRGRRFVAGLARVLHLDAQL